MIFSRQPKWLNLIYGRWGGICLKVGERIDIGVVSTPVILTKVGISISLDVAVGGDVVQDPAQVIFMISKNPYSTKLTVILNFSTPSLFLLWPTVLDGGCPQNVE